MTDMGRDVVARLVVLQGDELDEPFAERLGISRTHWSHIRAGRRRPTYALIRRAVKLYPELWPLVIEDIATDGTPDREAV